MSPGTQCAAILEHLQDGNTITPIEALDRFGCFRLGARIYDLRQSGHSIDRTMVDVGTGKHVAQYRLATDGS